MARTRARRTSAGSDALAAVILAAGEGTRMKSRTPKVLHRIAGRTLIEHVVDASFGARCDAVVTVVGAGADAVEMRVRDAFPGLDVRFALQSERRGTADAVRRAEGALKALAGGRRFEGDVLILCGDVPALSAPTLRALVRRHRSTGAALTVLTAEVDDPTGYGRIVRDAGGAILGIVEERDATRPEKALREINSGTYCARWPDLAAAIRKIRPDNAQGEYYLTDAVRVLLDAGSTVGAYLHGRPDDLQGVNGREQLAAAWRTLNARKLRALMAAGVTVVDPETTWVESAVRVGRDSLLCPGVTLEGTTRLGEGCVVRPGTRLVNVRAGRDVEFLDHTVAIDATLGDRTTVGPFANLRPGTALGKGCKLGNFVETKKTSMGDGSKASHLSYLGDAVIGKGVNVGAGTITCNYDGASKHLSRLGDGVFIGSDTQLVAPVTIGKGAYVGAGTTVTDDVPPDALAISRTKQRNIEGWARRKRRGGTKAGMTRSDSRRGAKKPGKTPGGPGS